MINDENKETENFEKIGNNILDENEGIDHTQAHTSNQNNNTIWGGNGETNVKIVQHGQICGKTYKMAFGKKDYDFSR